MMTVDEAVQKIVEIYEKDNRIGISKGHFEQEVFDFLCRNISLIGESDLEEIEKKIIMKLPSTCPKTGELFGYKVGDISNTDDVCYTPVIIKLRIPADAERVGIHFKRDFVHKCRCSYAFVEDIYDHYDNGIKFSKAHSLVRPPRRLEYKVGEKVIPDNYDTHPFKECSNGIHFFMTELETIYFYHYICQ